METSVLRGRGSPGPPWGSEDYQGSVYHHLTRWSAFVDFNRRGVLGCKDWIERYSLGAKLEGHRGCVNSVLWSEDGAFVISGSDDKDVRIWREQGGSSQWKCVTTLETGHSHNIFCATFVPGSCSREVVTCAGDGELRDIDVETATTRVLHSCPGICFKHCHAPFCPQLVLLTKQDGGVRQIDLREGIPPSLENRGRGGGVRLFNVNNFQEPSSRAVNMSTAIGFNPVQPYLFALGECSKVVRTFDMRMIRSALEADVCHDVSQMAVQQFYPETVMEDATDPDDLALSGLWWSKDGNSLLLNYRGSDMYEIKSLDKVERTRPSTSPASSIGSKSVVAVETSNLRVYTGRRNEETFAKECCMLNGDRYVATGGDCGHVYIWDRCTQRLQRKIKADTFVVNCVAPHPLGEPFLLTSGIDSDVKLWHTGTIRHTLKRDCSNNLLNGGLSRPLRSRLFGSQREDEAPTTIITIEEIRGRIDRANSKRQHANDAFRESRYQTALVLYSEVLDLLRYNSTEESDELERERRECAAITYSNMTACHIKLSSWADGLAASNSALELEPYLLKAILRRARCKFELNDFNGCRDDLSIAEHHRDIGPSGLHEIRKLRHEIAVKERESRRREQSFFARIFG
ncbi:conserved hypothetical protein [Perkinsus marinus ATCC 50983]|uniref:Uncharacterized protein n=1 Tax=Perkinsus marinus (strain ATCC 50983 / TXsc) TaxID=423536 RepID=C5K5A8_PERM5|nr:conserved hypothetical protein [Perkinsus marinus ATCC 50983]EER20530.1 conserved hypothetical protein [Perkinsus marinus ATCC 50983]|eukprot:XP_002788734.1 conserved hypothetical protein [Perkinsus marinus ATCC 50983]